MEKQENTSIIIEDTPVRKLYKQNMEMYRNKRISIQKDIDLITDKFKPKFKRNKFFIKFHFTNIFVFLSLAILFFIAWMFYLKSVFVPEFNLIIEGVIVGLFLLEIILTIYSKHHTKTLVKKQDKKINEVTKTLVDNGEAYLNKASRYVPELLIELFYQDKYLTFKANSTQEKFEIIHGKLTKTVNKIIKRNLDFITAKSLTDFYDNLYISKTMDRVNIDHAKRRAYANIKTKLQ